MTAIECIVIVTFGYMLGVYSMRLASKQQLKQASAMREQAAYDVRRAGRLYGLTMRALSSGALPRDWEAELDDESKTDQKPV